MKKDRLKVKVFQKIDHSIFLRVRNFIRLYIQISEKKNRLYSKDCYQRGFKMIKGSIHEEDMTAFVMYICNNKASKYMNEKVTGLKGEMDKFTIIVVDFLTPLSVLVIDKNQ